MYNPHPIPTTKLKGERIMKKTIKIIVLSGLMAIILLANFTTVATALAVASPSTIGRANAPLEQQLIGTWRWNDSPSWIVVFREDGTMLDGTSIWRTTFNWRVVNDRLLIDGVDWNVRIVGDTMTLDRHGFNTTYTYTWYSHSTEGETSGLIWLILLIFFLVLIAVITIVVIIVVRTSIKNNKQRQMHTHDTNPRY